MSRHVEKNVRCVSTEIQLAGLNLRLRCDGGFIRWDCFRKFGACECVCVLGRVLIMCAAWRLHWRTLAGF